MEPSRKAETSLTRPVSLPRRWGLLILLTKLCKNISHDFGFAFAPCSGRSRLLAKFFKPVKIVLREIKSSRDAETIRFCLTLFLFRSHTPSPLPKLPSRSCEVNVPQNLTRKETRLGPADLLAPLLRSAPEPRACWKICEPLCSIHFKTRPKSRQRNVQLARNTAL